MNAPPEVLIIGAGVAGSDRGARAHRGGRARAGAGGARPAGRTGDDPPHARRARRAGGRVRARRRRGDPERGARGGAWRCARPIAARRRAVQPPVPTATPSAPVGRRRHLLGDGRGARPRLGGRTRRILPAARRPGGRRRPRSRRGAWRSSRGTTRPIRPASASSRCSRTPPPTSVPGPIASSGSWAVMTAWSPPSSSASIPALCEVRLDTVVTAVSWGRRRVVVRTSTGEELAAPQLIVTVPLGVLKAGAIAFSPRLADKEDAIGRLEMGDAERVSLCLASDAWVAPGPLSPGRLPDDGRAAVSRLVGQPAAAVSGRHGWAGGRNARALGQLERRRAGGRGGRRAGRGAGRRRGPAAPGPARRVQSRLARRSVRPRRLQLCRRGRQRRRGRARRSDRRHPLLRGRGDRIRRPERDRPRRHRQRPAGRRNTRSAGEISDSAA